MNIHTDLPRAESCEPTAKAESRGDTLETRRPPGLAEGKLFLFAAIDHTSKFAVAQLVEKANRKTVWEFLEHLLAVVPYRIHTILTDIGIQFAEQLRNRNTIISRQMRFDMICEANEIEYRLTKPPVDKWPGMSGSTYSCRLVVRSQYCTPVLERTTASVHVAEQDDNGLFNEQRFGQAPAWAEMSVLRLAAPSG